MVMMVVIKNKNLQSTTNFFLMSLAAADFLVAAVVMPIYVLSETLGKSLWRQFYLETKNFKKKFYVF